MKVRHLVAACTIGIVSLVGTAGIAAAQTTPATPSTPAVAGARKQALCARATARLPQIQTRITNIEQHVTNLQAQLTAAQTKHHEKVAAAIQRRIDAWQKRHDHFVSLTNQITTRCGT